MPPTSFDSYLSSVRQLLRLAFVCLGDERIRLNECYIPHTLGVGRVAQDEVRATEKSQMSLGGGNVSSS